MNDKSTTQRLEPQNDKQTGEQAGAQSASPESVLPQGQSRLRRGIGRVLLVAAVAVGVAGLADWVYGRYTNVVVYDARIKADMIMISSRIDGWVTKVPVSEGSLLSAGQPLIMIDSRDSTLHLREIGAQRSSLQAERQRIEAEVRMIDQQTRGRHDASLAALTAAQAAKAGMDTEMEQIRADFERAESLMLK
ncbi:MAG: biotin/lipoyl-binding protein, partial [Alphaproteobacteria bacterium]|nr:biotin/lipoyl-binding protein [Alphaproteobacteria bacterium]